MSFLTSFRDSWQKGGSLKNTVFASFMAIGSKLKTDSLLGVLLQKRMLFILKNHKQNKKHPIANEINNTNQTNTKDWSHQEYKKKINQKKLCKSDPKSHPRKEYWTKVHILKK